MGKEEIARNEQFLLFPQCFLLNQKIISPFVDIYDVVSLFAAELEEPKIDMEGKELNSFPGVTNLDWFDLKGCGDNKLNVRFEDG